MLITDFLTNHYLSPEWDPIIFIPWGQSHRILCQPIECIRVICLTSNVESGPEAPNHWNFYISTSEENKTAIMLECSPGFGEQTTILESGCKAEILFEEKMTLSPDDTQIVFTLGVSSGLTVGDLHQLIIRHGRHKYEFDDSLCNGRAWVADQVNLFNRHGVFTNQDDVALLDYQIRKRWPAQVPAPLEMDRGVYYA
ncbi:hypothetical protein N7457_007107 [Penicillium paradoxum]|uniref:uncharacterized protein n=1 Tax=Penicillium paradoxum TaxID=176176 RepID=UPI002547F114|nr:uncharacterized protein N7457_007107 [Penicillium paradoxum]KAJ5779387.1 hypothetical protein N7457_007107 [Penicillium paradoxum]